MGASNLTAASMLMGICVDENHPEFEGLYQIEFQNEEGLFVRSWARTCKGVFPHQNEQVLISFPRNQTEPVILGVIATGLHEEKKTNPEFEVRPNNVLVLHGDAPIQVVTHDGRKLVEIGKGPLGPTIRICQRDATINLPGTLNITAGELNLQSRKGDIHLNADQEIILQGDMIRLN